MPDIPHKKIQEVILHLQQIHSTLVVTVAALKQQNCELDADIAAVLQRSAADRIQDQIETIDQILDL